MEDLWVIIELFFQLVCEFENFQNKIGRQSLEGAGTQIVGPELRKQTEPAAEGLPAGCGRGHKAARTGSLLEAGLPAPAQAGEGRRARGTGCSCSIPHHPHPGKVSSLGIKEGPVPGEAGVKTIL